MSRKPCHFYSKPGGCRHGATCHFAHDGPPGGGGETANPSPTKNNTLAAAVGGGGTIGDAPKGVCGYYWRTGECRRGFQCRYEHRRGPEANLTAESGPSSSGVFIPADIAPFLTSAAIARLSEPGTDALFLANTKARSPTEVHNLLKRFLYDSYRFRHTFDVYAFTSLLGDATTTNTTWVSHLRYFESDSV